MLYVHPAHLTDETINLIGERENICSYIDLPLQHASDKILDAMGRKVGQDYVLDLIAKINKNMSTVLMRSRFALHLTKTQVTLCGR